MYRVRAVPLAALVAMLVCAPTAVDIGVKLPMPTGAALDCTIERVVLAKGLDTYSLLFSSSPFGT